MSMFFAQNAPSEPIQLGYGYLYNWYVIDGNSTNLITGLHVPSDAEWTTLTTYSGGTSVAGGELKEVGTNHWVVPNTGATDTYGFTALPAGRRASGNFYLLGERGHLWSSTEFGASAYQRFMSSSTTNVDDDYYLQVHGMSIRCMRILTSAEQSTYLDGDVIESVLDYDGNSYGLIKIGTQGWMNINLKTTHYADGTVIPNITDDTEWAALTTAALCAFDNDPLNV